MRSIALTAASALLAGSLAAQASPSDFFTPLNHFSAASPFTSSSTLNLGQVRASADGSVTIYLVSGVNAGQEIGSSLVHEGVIMNQRVNVGRAPTTDVIAVLHVDGEPVA